MEPMAQATARGPWLRGPWIRHTGLRALTRAAAVACVAWCLAQTRQECPAGQVRPARDRRCEHGLWQLWTDCRGAGLFGCSAADGHTKGCEPSQTIGCKDPQAERRKAAEDQAVGLVCGGHACQIPEAAADVPTGHAEIGPGGGCHDPGRQGGRSDGAVDRLEWRCTSDSSGRSRRLGRSAFRKWGDRDKRWFPVAGVDGSTWYFGFVLARCCSGSWQTDRLGPVMPGVTPAVGPPGGANVGPPPGISTVLGTTMPDNTRPPPNAAPSGGPAPVHPTEAERQAMEHAYHQSMRAQGPFQASPSHATTVPSPSRGTDHALARTSRAASSEEGVDQDSYQARGCTSHGCRLGSQAGGQARGSPGSSVSTGCPTQPWRGKQSSCRPCHYSTTTTKTRRGRIHGRACCRRGVTSPWSLPGMNGFQALAECLWGRVVWEYSGSWD